MRLPRAQHMRLDALAVLGRRAAPRLTGTTAAWSIRSASSGHGSGSNPFLRAPTPLEGEDLPEAQSAPAPAKPWPKPQPVAVAPSPAKPRQPVKKVIVPDPPSTYRRAPTPMEGEDLPEVRPVPPPRKSRTATTPASPAPATCEPARTVPKQDPSMFRREPTPFPGESLIKPKPPRQKRTPPPEPAKAVPLSAEDARRLFIRKPELFEDEVAQTPNPSYLLAGDHEQVGDDQSQSDDQGGTPTVLDRRTLQTGKINSIITLYTDIMPAHRMPAVAIYDSLRCIASFSLSCALEDRSVRTMYVPGTPAVFKARKHPHYLTPGPLKNDLRPSFRFEAAFMALRAMSDLRLDDVDVVLSASYLQYLYASCSDKWFHVEKQVRPNSFTLIRDTLVIHGITEDDVESKASRESMGPRNLFSGHMFQHNFTEMPEEGVDHTDYFRVLQYRFGDLNCIVITETDAVLPRRRDGDDDERPSLDGTALSPEIPLDIQPVAAGRVASDADGAGWRPRLVPGGKFVERRTWTEMKVGNREFTDLTSQAYFNDSMFAVNAKVLGRDVYDLQYHDLRDRIRIWEQEEQLTLRRTVALLHKMRLVAKNEGEGATCSYWRAGKLQPGRSADQAGETAERSEEGADKPQNGAGPYYATTGRVALKIKTWHRRVRPLPQELIDHFWTTPSSETEQTEPRLVKYDHYPRRSIKARRDDEETPEED